MVAPLTTSQAGISFTTPQAEAEAIYVAYFGRAGDPSGVQSWINDLNGGQSIDAVAMNFAKSPEAQNLYPFLQFPTLDSDSFRVSFIESIYQNLFNRSADADGLAYWDAELKFDQEHLTGDALAAAVGGFILEVIRGAKNTSAGDDATTLANKVDVATYFTNNIAQHGVDYENNQPANIDALAHSLVDNTTSAPGSVTSEEHIFDDTFGVQINFTTATPETLMGSDGTDIFTGIVDNTLLGPASDNTLSPLDKAIGGAGNDTLKIIVEDNDFGTHIIAPNAVEVETVSITDMAPAGSSYDLQNVPNVEHLVIAGSTNDIEIFNIQNTTSLEIDQLDNPSADVDLTYIDAVGTFDQDWLLDNVGSGLHIDVENTSGDDILTGLNIETHGTTEIASMNDASLLTVLNVEGDGTFAMDLSGGGTEVLASIDASDFTGDSFSLTGIEAGVDLTIQGPGDSTDAELEVDIDAAITLSVTTNDGDDTVDIEANDFSSTIVVDTGAGNDSVSSDGNGPGADADFQSISVDVGSGLNDVEIDTGMGSTVSVSGGDDGNTIDIDSQDGDDSAATPVGTTADVETGSGADNIHITHSGSEERNDSINVSAGEGDNEVEVDNFGDNATISIGGGDGANDVNVTEGDDDAAINIALGGGGNDVEVEVDDTAAVTVTSGDGADTVDVDAESNANVDVSVAGGADNVTIDVGDPSTVTVDLGSGANTLHVTSGDDAHINVTGGDDGNLVSIGVATGGTGSTVSVTTGDGVDNVTVGNAHSHDHVNISTGEGNDTVRIDVLTSGITLNGGDGTDLLRTTSNGAGAGNVAGSISGFEALEITNTLVNDINLVQDFGGSISHVILDDGVSGTRTISGFNTPAQLDYLDQSSGAVLNISMNNAAINTNDNFHVLLDDNTVSGTSDFGSLTFADIETLTIDSTSSGGTPIPANNTNVITVDGGTALDHIVLVHDAVGDADLTLAGAALQFSTLTGTGFTEGVVLTDTNTTEVTITLADQVSVDAAGGVNVNNITVNGDGNFGANITVGNANSTISTVQTGDVAADDSIVAGGGTNTILTGAGNDHITVGTGHNVITPGLGIDTVDLGAGGVSSTVVFTAVADSGFTLADSISNFIGGASGDKLDFSAVAGITATDDYVEVHGAVAVGVAVAADSAANSTFVYDLDNGDLYVDVNHDHTLTAADMQVHLTGTVNLSHTANIVIAGGWGAVTDI